MNERDVVFFLGAGFSADADLPVMSHFGRYAELDRESMRRKHGPDSPDPRLAAPFLLEQADLFLRYRRDCQSRVQGTPNFCAENMEDLFTLAEIMRECGQNYIELDGEKIKLDDLLTAIKFWMWKVYQRIPIHNPNQNNKVRDPVSDAYKSFAKSVQEFGGDRVSLVTTNYDMVPEYMCYKYAGGMLVYYPFSENEVEFCDIGGRKDRFAGICREHAPGPVLCKLHGSINYFMSEQNLETGCCDSAKLSLIANTPKEKNIGYSYPNGNPPAIMAVDAIYELQQHSEQLAPAVIPPTYAKLEGHSWLRQIWKASLESLVSATTWVFIGYSFPPSDGFMKSLVTSALMMRGTKNRFPKITVVDPCSDTEQRYEEIFGKDAFNFREEKFSEFMRGGHCEKVLYGHSTRAG